MSFSVLAPVGRLGLSQGTGEGLLSWPLPTRPSLNSPSHRSSSTFLPCQHQGLLSPGSGLCQNPVLISFLRHGVGRHVLCISAVLHPLESEPPSLSSSCRILSSDSLPMVPCSPLSRSLGPGRHGCHRPGLSRKPGHGVHPASELALRGTEGGSPGKVRCCFQRYRCQAA